MLFQELGKLKRSSIVTSIILMAVGILMIMCPEQYITSLVSLLGDGMMVFAVVLVFDFISGKKSLMNYVWLVVALIMALLGFAVLVSPNIVRIISLIFGLVLMADGVIHAVNSWTYVRRAERKGWWVLILLAALMFVFGVILLFNHWWREPSALFDIIGGMLLFSSLVSIVRLILVWPIRGTEGELSDEE